MCAHVVLCSMLGLGDIVIPGIFVALLLRYDVTHNGGSTAYFYRCSLPDSRFGVLSCLQSLNVSQSCNAPAHVHRHDCSATARTCISMATLMA